MAAAGISGQRNKMNEGGEGPAEADPPRDQCQQRSGTARRVNHDSTVRSGEGASRRNERHPSRISPAQWREKTRSTRGGP
eukprot:scaffold73938_cov36-Phaeocystis_antarctica.AAC.1